MSIFYGIDFGTTNTALVTFDERTLLTQNIGEDGSPIPSVVAVRTFDDKVTVGRKVRREIQSLDSDERHLIFRSVKTVLDTDDVWETDTRAWNAEEISAELFKALVERAHAANLPPLERAVVAIPVGMNAAKRQVLRRAAGRCGVEIAAFITEPTAAFIAHANELRKFRTIMVFDWGGGTLDISILRHTNGRIIEVQTAGLPLAGDDIDEALALWAHERIAEKNNLKIPFDAVPEADRRRLLNECESAKIALQEDGTEEVSMFISKYAGLKLVEQSVTCSTFEGLVQGFVDRAIELLFRCLHESGTPLEEIGKVLVVGGTSKMLFFQRELRRRWGVPNLMFPTDAEWDIARGAVSLAKEPGCYRTAERIGLELSDGKFYATINDDTSIDEASNTVHLALVEDANTASLVFATQKAIKTSHRRVGELHIPCKGFSDESIRLSCRITEDLIFEAIADSSHIQSNRAVSHKFVYDELRWQYDIKM